MRGTWRLAGLFAFVQLYELALVGLAAFIERFVAPRDRAARRDAVTLVVLEALFLGDFSFLSVTIPGTATTGMELGVEREDLVGPLLAAAVAVALGPLKLWLAGRAIRIEWPRALLAFATFALAAIHGGPILVLIAGETGHASSALASLWWIVALLPAVLAWAGRDRRATILGGVLVVAAASHVFAACWAHDVRIHAWQPAPLILGALVAAPRIAPRHARSKQAVAAYVVGAGGAILFALTAPRGATLAFGPVETTPLRAMAVAAALVLADGSRVTGSRLLRYAALAAALFATLGADGREVGRAFGHPPTATTALLTAIAALATVFPVNHLGASGCGLAAAWALGTDGAGSDRGGELAFASFVLLHQCVLAHRHASPAWLRLRTAYAWSAAATALLAARAWGPGALDAYVVGLAGLALLAWLRGLGPAHGPLALGTTIGLALLRGGHLVPRERAGIGLLALVGGVGSLVLGTAVTVGRTRLLAQLAPPEVLAPEANST